MMKLELFRSLVPIVRLEVDTKDVATNSVTRTSDFSQTFIDYSMSEHSSFFEQIFLYIEHCQQFTQSLLDSTHSVFFAY